MKGYYTVKLLKSDKIYQSLIYSYMDKIILNLEHEEIYNQFTHEFNKEGEFIYRAIHNPQSEFDKYSEVEMVVNDNGVFVQGEKNNKLSTNYLQVLNAFKDKYNQEQYILQR
jgi:hypothetical protein